ncbi:MAG: DUF2927 domain-containing protein [Rhodobacterales bacterium]
MRQIAGRLSLLAGALLLAGCDMPVATDVAPERVAARPAARPAPQVQAEPSEASQTLARYYERLEADLLSKGLLRTDGGGRDTPFAVHDLVRNFELIAFFDEYERGAGLKPSWGKPVPLRRWAKPVGVTVEFGSTVPPAQRAADLQDIGAYASRLTRITGHPVRMDAAQPNMHILIFGEDDRALLPQRARQIVPGMSAAAMSIFRTMPRNIHCFVMAFSGGGGDPYTYRQAIVVIRAEHPDLLRQSCIHEEMAQGLGLANDTPRARPSIFNDDDEFALLTNHDELLLRMLYDPRLIPGMTLEEARPIIRQIAEELMRGGT